MILVYCSIPLPTKTLIVPNAPVTQAEAKLVAVAKFAMKKAISSRPHSVSELVPLLVD